MNTIPKVLPKKTKYPGEVESHSLFVANDTQTSKQDLLFTENMDGFLCR